MLKTLLVLMAVIASLSSRAQYYSYRQMGDHFYGKGNYRSAAYYYAKYFNGEIPSKNYSPYNFQKQGARIINNNTVPTESAFRLGDCYYHLKKYDLAELLFKALVAEKPDEYPQARILYAVCLREKGQYDDAMTQLEMYIRTHPVMDEYGVLAHKEVDACIAARNKANKKK